MDSKLLAHIAQAHTQDKHITLALFGVAVKEDLELAQHIAQHYAHSYEQHIQQHMANMIEAQLKLNAAHDVITRVLLKHALTMLDSASDELTAQVHTASIGAQAEQATAALLSKLRLH